MANARLWIGALIAGVTAVLFVVAGRHWMHRAWQNSESAQRRYDVGAPEAENPSERRSSASRDKSTGVSLRGTPDKVDRNQAAATGTRPRVKQAPEDVGEQTRVPTADPEQSEPGTNDDADVLMALRTGTRAERLRAAATMSRSPSSESVRTLLTETALCEDLIVRQRLLEIVRQTDGAQYANQLVEVLRTLQNGDLRSAAQDALVASSAPQAVRSLRQTAETGTSSEIVVRDIGRTLARFRGERAISELLAGIESPLPAVQAGCVAALAEIGTAEVVVGFYNKFEASDAARREMILEGFRRVRNADAAAALARIAGQTTDPKLKAVIDDTIANAGMHSSAGQ